MIIWAQKTERITGQSKVTSIVKELKIHTKLIEFSLSFSYLLSTISLFITVFTKQSKVLYFVPSRSKLGMLKDLPILIVASTNIRIIAHLHGSDSIAFLSYIIKIPILRRAYKNMVFISPSYIISQSIIELGFTCVTIENFAKLQEPQNVLSNVDCVEKEDVQLIVWNSNIMASKGVLELLEAVRLLNNDGINIHVVLFGAALSDTEMSSDKILQRLDIYSKLPYVSHLGPHSAGEIQKFLKQANMVVLPSRYPTECQPLSLIEAMLNSLKIIIADRDVLTETAGTYKNTIRVKPSVNGVYEGIINALELPVSVCDKETIQRFSYERFTREFTTLVTSLADG